MARSRSPQPAFRQSPVPARAVIAAVAVCLALAAAACGGADATKGDDLGAVCARQRAALAHVGTPVGLDGAARALRAVIATDRALIGVLEAREGHTELVAKLRRSEQGAARGLASIERTDPDRSMSPLRTGQASGRRVVGAARALLADACGSG